MCESERVAGDVNKTVNYKNIFFKIRKSDLELYCNDHACRTSCMNFIPPYMKLLIFCGFFIPVWILVIGFYGKILSISRSHLNSMDKIEKSIQPKRKISM